VNQIVSCRLIFQLWKLPSSVRDGCIYCEYKWIIDVDIALLDSTTVLGFRSRTEARSAEGMLIEAGERVRTVRVVLGGLPMRSTRLLVVADESKASKRAVSYVAQMVGRRRGFNCLVYTLSEIPASLIEYGGAKNPEEEEKLDGELHAEQKHWVLAAQEKAKLALDRAGAALRKAGLAAGAIEARFCGSATQRTDAREATKFLN